MNIIERVKAFLKKHFTGEIFYGNGGFRAALCP